MKIYKYPIPLQDHTDIYMPKNSKILTFQEQHDNLFIWALCPDTELEQRHFTLIGTGKEFNFFPPTMIYIGTAQINKGTLVWHLFEDLNE